MKAGSPGRPAPGQRSPPGERTAANAVAHALALAAAVAALLLAASATLASSRVLGRWASTSSSSSSTASAINLRRPLALAVPAVPATRGLAGPGGEEDDAFLRGGWLEPGRELAWAMKSRFAPARPELVKQAVARWGETTQQIIEDPGAWEPAAGPGGSEVLWLRRPLNRDGSAGPAGSRRPSPGCAGLERVFRDYLDEPERRGQFKGDSLRAKPLMCVDVDMAAASPLVLSTPSYSGKYALDDFLVEDKLVGRGGNQAVPFLLAAVLPLLPADAKGSFVLQATR